MSKITDFNPKYRSDNLPCGFNFSRFAIHIGPNEQYLYFTM